jgi:replicative DNA helicase
MRKPIVINLFGAPGSGKCFAKGTKVLMWNGEIKNIEDIMVGDWVMGDDSTPREVLELHQGKAPMYLLKRSFSKDIVVSANHILSLMCYHKNKTWTYEDISIEDFLNKGIQYKHYARLYKTEVNFSTQSEKCNLKIDPYYLGYWLGDGISESINRFCTADQEVIDYCKQYAKELKLELKQHSFKEGKCQTYCLSEGNIGGKYHQLSGNIYNLIRNKHIPKEYKTTTLENRLALIAGLIDSDGSLNKTSYDWINKNKILAYDFYCLVNSCGLRATISECQKSCGDFTGTYYRVNITGNLSIIPVKISRKICKQTIQDTAKTLREGFKVIPLGEDEFYGFTTDGNHRFVLDDCTVVHNSTAAAYIFARLKMRGYNCELITEYAKDKTWEGNTTALSCQEYIFGKQSFRMMRCRDKVDIIITDSPLPLGIFYNENPVLDHSYEEMVLKVFYSYHNYNYFLVRCQPYNPIGRNQTQAEADVIGDKIQMFLDDNGIIYEAGLG